MHRRRFLKIVGRFGAGIGATVPLLGLVPATATAEQRTDRGLGKKALAVSLNTGWSVGIDPANVGRDRAWFEGPQQGAKATSVPSIIQQHYPGYHGVAWYWLEFKPETNPLAGGRYLFQFHAVDYLADVWMNGKHLGRHEGGETPFLVDATEVIIPDRPNRLAVRVLNPSDDAIDGVVLAETPHRNKVVKFANGSLYDYGGIVEPVELLLVPAIRISDVFVTADWKTGEMQIEVTLTNASGRAETIQLNFMVTENGPGTPALTDTVTLDIPEGDGKVNRQLRMADYEFWSLDNPHLYHMTVSVETKGVDGAHQASTTFGFKDFRLTNGYFRLNGKRIFLKCTHTGNHSPFGQVNPPDSHPDLLRRDLLYAKASGFNTVRFISGLAHPYQLDLCDEIGLLIYEEPAASWLLKDSPHMKGRYENSVREMLLRDRNHPCVAIWGMLNETSEGPVFEEARAGLPLVRSLDVTRLVLLSSGRFDGHLGVGSASNPGSSEWEYVWGKEAPGAGHVSMALPSGPGSGDFHLYPLVPQTSEVNHAMRTLGQGGKPVFLSEYGIGSMMNVIHEVRMYEQAGIPKDAEDFVLMKSMADGFSADWARFGMGVVYAYPEILLQMSQRKMARHRLLGFNLIRSNPMICGFNLTGMLDHALTGEGVWRFWRDWKPELFDAMQDGWAPVRWCLFVEPTHTYVGQPIRLEAVLANEDVLRPGEYPAEFQVWGPSGSAWHKQAVISIPEMKAGDGPLAVPVMKEEAVIEGPAGTYDLIPSIPRGISPPDTSWQFYVSDTATFPKLQEKILTWGIPDSAELWLGSRGASVTPLEQATGDYRDLILVGNVSGAKSDAGQWRKLAERMATGSTVVFLSPHAFAREENPQSWLPLINKGKIIKFQDFLYHKECVAKSHQVFEGLQANGILDWYYYGPVLPSYIFQGQEIPQEVIAAAFATGYSTLGGYASGVLLGLYNFGSGRFVVNSFPILENLGKHPVADRLLLNMVKYAASFPSGPAARPPAELRSILEQIGYTS
jgi:hypothetical protein